MARVETAHIRRPKQRYNNRFEMLILASVIHFRLPCARITKIPPVGSDRRGGSVLGVEQDSQPDVSFGRLRPDRATVFL